MQELQINFLGVTVSAVLSFALGAIWYSPALFGKAWMKALGKTAEELKNGASGSIYLITFFSFLIACFVLDNIINFTLASSLVEGIMVGILCWLGFVAATSLIHNLFAGRSYKLWLIEQGYILVAFVISGGILAIWR